MKDFKILTKYIDASRNLSRYYSDLAKEERLTHDEEAELAVKAKAGDASAKDKIIRANLRFAISVAKSYTSNISVLEDLISEGNKGLVEAIEKYDPTTGFKFISYAVWHIRKNILSYINNQKSIRIPVNITTEIRKYQKAVDYFINQNDREPTISEMMQLFEDNGSTISKNTLEVIENNPTLVPLEYEGDNGNDEIQMGPIGWVSSDEPAPDQNLRMEDYRESIRKLMSILKDQEKYMVSLRYGLIGDGDVLTYREIGLLYGRTSEWARNVINKAERKMRAKSRMSNGRWIEP